ncbi:hypothetical protein R6Q59_020742 [Mikania micrantha]
MQNVRCGFGIRTSQIMALVQKTWSSNESKGLKQQQRAVPACLVMDDYELVSDIPQMLPPPPGSYIVIWHTDMSYNKRHHITVLPAI